MKRFTFLLAIIILVLCACTRRTDLYRVQEDGLYGFINESGEVMISPQYKYVGGFTKDGYACVVSDISFEEDSSLFGIGIIDSIVVVSYGYINRNNDLVVDTNNVIRFSISRANGIWVMGNAVDFAHQYVDDRLGFNATSLQELDFNDGLYLFQDRESNLFGYKDIKGKIKIEAKFEWGHSFSNGVAVVREIKVLDLDKDFDITGAFNSCGVIDKSGNVIFSGYTIIHDYGKNGLTWAQTTNITMETYEFKRDWVQIDKQGNIKIGPVPGVAWVYNNDDFPVCVINLGLLGDYYTFIDEKGEFLSDFNNDKEVGLNFTGEKRDEIFENVTRFGNGAAGIKGYDCDGESVWYFVDRDFNIISELYDSVLCFDNGYAAVKERVTGHLKHAGNWGYAKIDEANYTINQVIPCKYSECGRFRRELAYFKKNGATFDVEGLINKQGNVVWQTKRLHNRWFSRE